MKFSIIIPVYNAEKYLRLCLDSLKSQTYTNYEVIIIDDGSTDGSRQVYQSYDFNNMHYKILVQENQGPFMARRNGLKVVQSDYTLFLDSDDLLAKDCLEKLNQFCESSKPDIVLFDIIRGSDIRSQCSKEREFQRIEPTYFLREVCLGRTNNLCGKLFLTSNVANLSDISSSICDIKHGEDLFQLLEFIQGDESVYRIHQPFYFYRNNGSSLTNSYKRSQADDLLIVGSSLFKFGRQHGLQNEAAIGTILQFCYLLKILNNSEISNVKRVKEAAYIKNTLLKLYTYEDMPLDELRFDQKLIIKALIKDQYTLMFSLLNVVELFKLIFGKVG